MKGFKPVKQRRTLNLDIRSLVIVLPIDGRALICFNKKVVAAYCKGPFCGPMLGVLSEYLLRFLQRNTYISGLDLEVREALSYSALLCGLFYDVYKNRTSDT